MSKVVYNNMLYGEVGTDVLGRPDIAPYTHGLQRCENFNVNLLGGITRRKGLRRLFNTDTEARLLDFVYSSTLSFLVILENERIRVYNASLNKFEYDFRATDEVPLFKSKDLKEVQYTQDSDTIYMVHKDYRPITLHYTGSVFEADVFKPECDDDYKDLFTTKGNYPSVVAFCSNRLILASSVNDPYRIWISKALESSNFWTYDLNTTTESEIVDASQYEEFFNKWKNEGDKTTKGTNYTNWLNNTLLNSEWWKNRTEHESDVVPEWQDLLATDTTLFNKVMTTEDKQVVTRSISASDAMVLDLGSNKNDKINWIGLNYNIMIGTATSEWVMPSTIDATNQSISQVSSYGSKGIQAVCFCSKVMFLQTETILRAMYYDSQTHSYPCSDKTQFNRDILKGEVCEMTVQRVPIPRVFLTLKDGSVAVFTLNEYANIEGFTKYISEVGHICSISVLDSVNGQDVYALVDNSKIKGENDALEYYVCVFDSTDNKDLGQYFYQSVIETNPIESASYQTIDNTKYGWSVALRIMGKSKFKVCFTGASVQYAKTDKSDVVVVHAPTNWEKELKLKVESTEDNPLTIQALEMSMGVV